MSITHRELKRLLERRLTPGRFLHSVKVEEMAMRLASAHGVDVIEAGFAGLAHDICRCDTPERQMALLRGGGIRLTAEWMANPQIWHSVSGSVFLRRELGVRERGILWAVRSHTTGRRGMSALEKVVFLADNLSEDRSFEGIEERRALSMRSLDEAMRESLAFSVGDAVKKGKPLVRECWEAYNELMLRESGVVIREEAGSW